MIIILKTVKLILVYNLLLKKALITGITGQDGFIAEHLLIRLRSSGTIRRSSSINHQELTI